MDLGLKNKVAFIAASSQGLGKAVAKELALEGAHVIINGRSEGPLSAAAKEIQVISKGKVLVVQGDLSDEGERNKVIETTLKAFGKIDILVTNSGGPPPGKFESFKKEDWDRAYELLLGSAVGLIQGFLPGMKDNNGGRIIAITSMAVKQPVPNLILSNSVRASVVGLLKTLSLELAPFNITVNNVMPGYTNTERLAKLINANPAFQNAIDQVPLKRMGTPEEFAAAVVFLASERASYITGVSLAVDGGNIQNLL
jgi:3-oxoacyl-[acyl-carrier protein] reductase